MTKFTTIKDWIYVLCILLASWGMCGNNCPQNVDFYDDDCINSLDLGILLTMWSEDIIRNRQKKENKK